MYSGFLGVTYVTVNSFLVKENPVLPLLKCTSLCEYHTRLSSEGRRALWVHTGMTGFSLHFGQLLKSLSRPPRKWAWSSSSGKLLIYSLDFQGTIVTVISLPLLLFYVFENLSGLSHIFFFPRSSLLYWVCKALGYFLKVRKKQAASATCYQCPLGGAGLCRLVGGSWRWFPLD